MRNGRNVWNKLQIPAPDDRRIRRNSEFRHQMSLDVPQTPPLQQQSLPRIDSSNDRNQRTENDQKNEFHSDLSAIRRVSRGLKGIFAFFELVITKFQTFERHWLFSPCRFDSWRIGWLFGAISSQPRLSHQYYRRWGVWRHWDDTGRERRWPRQPLGTGRDTGYNKWRSYRAGQHQRGRVRIRRSGMTSLFTSNDVLQRQITSN